MVRAAAADSILFCDCRCIYICCDAQLVPMAPMLLVQLLLLLQLLRLLLPLLVVCDGC